MSALTSQPALSESGTGGPVNTHWPSSPVAAIVDPHISLDHGGGGHGHGSDVISSGGGNEDSVNHINYVAYGVVANIIVGIGIIGNVLNLIVLTRPKLKGVMYVYLLGLAVSNLCVLVTAIPALMDLAGAGGLQNQSYATAFFQAHLEMPLLNSFMASSVYIIICMTVNRYISIYKPTHFQRIHTFKNAYLAIAFSFVGGMVLHIPLAFEAGVVEMDEDHYETAENEAIAGHSLYRVYLWISEALLRLGPIVTLTILNILIIVRFQRIALRREELRGTGGAHRGSNAPPSPYSTTNGPVSTSNRLSVTQINGKLAPMTAAAEKVATPASAPTAVTTTASSTSNGNGGVTTVVLVVPTADTHGGSSVADPSSSAVGSGGEASCHNGGAISRAVTPSHNGGGGGGGGTGFSPSRSSFMQRGTPSRCSSSIRRRGLHNPEERMLVVVLVSIVVLFVVCTTPAAFLSILVTDERKKLVWFAIFRACANNLELLCFALNFFVYCLCSADIRQAFVDVLFENGAVLYLRRKSLSAVSAVAGAGTGGAANNHGGNNGIEMTNVNGPQHV